MKAQIKTNTKSSVLASTIIALGLLAHSFTANAADYTIDTKGMHASIQFRVQHLGYSWLYGNFNDFSGSFSYDEAAPEKTTVSVQINPASIDSNHAERDKHLRSPDFLDVAQFPEASFVSTGYQAGADGSGTLSGDLTLHGVTKTLDINVQHIGGGDDPWGGYRQGFQGSTTFAMADFGILKNLGPKSKNVEMILAIEGIRNK